MRDCQNKECPGGGQLDRGGKCSACGQRVVLLVECVFIDAGDPALAPGWICCGCRTYNGLQRSECKFCGYTRCASVP